MIFAIFDRSKFYSFYAGIPFAHFFEEETVSKVN